MLLALTARRREGRIAPPRVIEIDADLLMRLYRKRDDRIVTAMASILDGFPWVREVVAPGEWTFTTPTRAIPCS